jgi:hypothetical protein
LAATILLVAEQTTAMLAAAGRRTAARLAARRSTAARLAAALLEQTSVGLLFASHGVADHGRQHGDCRNDDTIHLKSSHV